MTHQMPRSYPRESAAAFRRSRERYGQLSNMTFGYPLTVNGLTFQGPEGLYQALKYPADHDLQRRIASQRSGMEAKKAAYAGAARPRPDWDSRRVQAMTCTLAEKLAQHPETFAAALRETEGLIIVENSQRDPFWGAQPVPGGFRGVNALGQLLNQLRDLLEESGDPQRAAHLMARSALNTIRADSVSNIPLSILGQPLQPPQTS